MNTSVLAHLVRRFNVPAENLATEALCFALSGSATARAALKRQLGQLGFEVPAALTYRTQVSDNDGARPDLVGRANDGGAHVIIEAKFWAGLTDRQPAGYLRGSLPASTGACLLFVAPERRRDSLWRELLRLCDSAGLRTEPLADHGDHGRSCRVGRDVMALVSWRALLRAMHTAARDAGEQQQAEDLQQLQALCDEQDSSAFLPLQRDELTGSLAQRVVQLADLVLPLAERLQGHDLIDLSGLRASTSPGVHYTRYVRFVGYPAMLSFNARLWARHGAAPLWLSLAENTWGPQPPIATGVGEHLRGGGMDFVQHDNYLHVPLFPPVGEERQSVLDSLAEQVRAVSLCLPAPDFNLPAQAVPPELR